MLAFLGHRGVIDDQYRIAAADKPIRLNEQFPLQRRQIPDTTSNKVMQHDHSRSAQDVPPLAERSCDHRARSAPKRKADTSAAVPCDPSAPETAQASL